MCRGLESFLPLNYFLPLVQEHISSATPEKGCALQTLPQGLFLRCIHPLRSSHVTGEIWRVCCSPSVGISTTTVTKCSFLLGLFPCLTLGSVQRRNDEPPKMVLEPVRVHESSSVVVTNSSLNLQDLDTQNSELVIVVTKSPEHGKS